MGLSWTWFHYATIVLQVHQVPCVSNILHFNILCRAFYRPALVIWVRDPPQVEHPFLDSNPRPLQAGTQGPGCDLYVTKFHLCFIAFHFILIFVILFPCRDQKFCISCLITDMWPSAGAFTDIPRSCINSTFNQRDLYGLYDNTATRIWGLKVILY